MNEQQIIDWKMAQLEQGANDAMPEAMQAYLSEHPALQNELVFLASFWQHESTGMPQPSAKLRDNFYNMLEGAKSAQTEHVSAAFTETNNASTRRDKSKFLTWLSGWLAPNPAAQFASFALIFVLGMGVNQMVGSDSEPEQGLVALQQEVSSLSSLVAISMLQKPSASERLTGVAYSSQTDLSDPNLSQTLIDLLANDKSTAVRLAIVNTLADANSLSGKEQTLVTLAVNESNPLVQMALCRLLLINGTSETQRTLLEKLQSITLHEDVADFIDEIRSASRA